MDNVRVRSRQQILRDDVVRKNDQRNLYGRMKVKEMRARMEWSVTTARAMLEDELGVSEMSYKGHRPISRGGASMKQTMRRLK